MRRLVWVLVAFLGVGFTLAAQGNGLGRGAQGKGNSGRAGGKAASGDFRPEDRGLIAGFYRSAVGKKAVMAATGIFLFGWIFAHMVGNLKVFMGPEHFNEYAALLRTMGAPALPHTTLLWIVRALMVIARPLDRTAGASQRFQMLANVAAPQFAVGLESEVACVLRGTRPTPSGPRAAPRRRLPAPGRTGRPCARRPHWPRAVPPCRRPRAPLRHGQARPPGSRRIPCRRPPAVPAAVRRRHVGAAHAVSRS